MGRRAKSEVARPADSTSSVAGSSDIRPSSMPGEDAGRSPGGREAGSDGEQQQRPRRAYKRRAGSGDSAGSGVGLSEQRDAAEQGTEDQALSSVRMGSMDLGGVQDGRDAPMPDAERALLDAIGKAPVFSRGSLLRYAALNAKPGIACEFGVFGGASLSQIRNYRKPPVFGFDSWKGLPAAWNIASDVTYEAGHFARDKPTDFATGVQLVEGWFNETIPQWLAETEGAIQMLHVDCDLYWSCKDVLFGLNDRLVEGTVIVFDELCNFGDGYYEYWTFGEWKALNEWIAAFGRTVQPIGRTEFQQVAFVIKG